MWVSRGVNILDAIKFKFKIEFIQTKVKDIFMYYLSIGLGQKLLIKVNDKLNRFQTSLKKKRKKKQVQDFDICCLLPVGIIIFLSLNSHLKN